MTKAAADNAPPEKDNTVVDSSSSSWKFHRPFEGSGGEGVTAAISAAAVAAATRQEQGRKVNSSGSNVKGAFYSRIIFVYVRVASLYQF